MLGTLIVIAVVAGGLWYFQVWPFDGTTKLPRRNAPPAA
jgi:hypothetical protein